MYYKVTNGKTMRITNVSRNIPDTTGGAVQKTFILNVGAGYDAVYVNRMNSYNYQEGNIRSWSFSYNKSNGNISITFNIGENKQFVAFNASIVFACIKLQ